MFAYLMLCKRNDKAVGSVPIQYQTRCGWTEVVSIEEDQVGDDLKPVVSFKGIEKPWPINMTGLEVLAELTGSQDTEDFDGAKVEVFVDPDVRYAGKRVGGIKLRPIPSKLQVNDDGALFDDAIPF